MTTVDSCSVINVQSSNISPGSTLPPVGGPGNYFRSSLQQHFIPSCSTGGLSLCYDSMHPFDKQRNSKLTHPSNLYPPPASMASSCRQYFPIAPSSYRLSGHARLEPGPSMPLLQTIVDAKPKTTGVSRDRIAKVVDNTCFTRGRTQLRFQANKDKQSRSVQYPPSPPISPSSVNGYRMKL